MTTPVIVRDRQELGIACGLDAADDQCMRKNLIAAAAAALCITGASPAHADTVHVMGAGARGAELMTIHVSTDPADARDNLVVIGSRSYDGAAIRCVRVEGDRLVVGWHDGRLVADLAEGHYTTAAGGGCGLVNGTLLDGSGHFVRG